MGQAAGSAEIAPRVRPAETGDASDVATLLEALGYPCTRAEAAERIALLRDIRDQHLLLAELEGVVCGLGAVQVMYSLARGADIARVTALVVAPACHRQGIGRQLLREMESLARRAGAIRLEVTSNPRRVDAHAFYHACGYADGSRHFVKLLGD